MASKLGAMSFGAMRRLGAAAGVALLATATFADAAPRVCRQIEAQLAEAERGGTSAAARRYDRAIAQQRQQLARADRYARRLGCGSYDEDFRCASLDGTMARMEDNLDQLNRTRGRMERGGGDRRLKQRLLAKLEANGCRGEQRQAAKPEPREKPQMRATLDPGNVPVTIPDKPGQFRTLCVRTCDGYFFPMSYAAASADFARDEAACQAACPGTEVKLYVHKTPEQESESMVSAAGGAPYRELPTAFRYRDTASTKPAGCGCGVPKNFSIIAGEPKPEEVDIGETAAVPVPTARPDLGGKPPAVAAAPQRAADPQPAAANVTKEKKVRVVGPGFLPDQEGAIDLQAPAPN